MKKHGIIKEAPKTWRVPNNIPTPEKYSTLYVDIPWAFQQGGNLGAINAYVLTAHDRMLQFPLKDLAADNCTLWLWTTNACLEQALEIIRKNGFTYRGYYVWCKPKLGLGQYLRNSTELLLVATRGKVKFKSHSEINWGIMPTTHTHSEKPREVVSIIERCCDGPYLELFCRKRPASTEPWRCWGMECAGGSDIYIPGWPVPRYSFDPDFYDPTADPSDKEEV